MVECVVFGRSEVTSDTTSSECHVNLYEQPSTPAPLHLPITTTTNSTTTTAVTTTTTTSTTTSRDIQLNVVSVVSRQDDVRSSWSLPASPGRDGLPSLTTAAEPRCRRVAMVSPFTANDDDDSDAETDVKTCWTQQHASNVDQSDDETYLKPVFTAGNSARQSGGILRRRSGGDGVEEDEDASHGVPREPVSAMMSLAADDVMSDVTSTDEQQQQQETAGNEASAARHLDTADCCAGRQSAERSSSSRSLTEHQSGSTCTLTDQRSAPAPHTVSVCPLSTASPTAVDSGSAACDDDLSTTTMTSSNGDTPHQPASPPRSLSDTVLSSLLSRIPSFLKFS